MLARTFSHVACGKKTRWTSMPYDSATWASCSASVRFWLVSPFVGPTMNTALRRCGAASALADVVRGELLAAACTIPTLIDVVASNARRLNIAAATAAREIRFRRTALTDNC